MSSISPDEPTAVDRTAPRPHDDSRRLDRLYALGILDTPPDAFSEAIVAAAASIANTPIAGLSLIDDHRLWFKAVCGLDAKEADRDIAFCSYAVLDTRPFVIPDTRLDPRFAANPLVVGPPHVRFYAGFPLIVQGQPIGALCVLDDRPRTLSSAQTQQLVELATGIAAWLQRHPHGSARP